MNNIRVKFIRGEEVKYISHLDLMKVFERALRRASVPIAYSQGFNPHPHMVFGLPLSVGVTSEAEYADFEFTADVNPTGIAKALNKALPQGFHILDARYKSSRDNIMATITGARYEVLLYCPQTSAGELQQKLELLMQQSAILVEKETKKGIREVDIRPMIHQVALESMVENGDDPVCHSPFICRYAEELVKLPYYIERGYGMDHLFCLRMMVDAGSVSNVRPDLVVAALAAFSGLEIKTCKIHRSALYVHKNEKDLDPMADSILTEA